jgi:hypothetical protein
MSFVRGVKRMIKMIITHAEMPLGFMPVDLGREGTP